MTIFQIILLFFLIVPFLEIYLLLKIGAIVGAMPTVLLVVFTAVLGAWLLRKQGLSTLQRFQRSLEQGQIPAVEMIEGPILLVGGALLLTPGFFTDILGFACLVPAARRKVALYVIENYLVAADGSFKTAKSKTSKHNVIEGEFKRSDDE
jgi:UPF0716 protein FxsA